LYQTIKENKCKKQGNNTLSPYLKKTRLEQMIRTKVITIAILTSLMMTFSPLLNERILRDNPDEQTETATEIPEENSNEQPASPTNAEPAEPGKWAETENGKKYLVESKPVKGWFNIKGSWYYFGADGNNAGQQKNRQLCSG
jgi:hypothetical protein